MKKIIINYLNDSISNEDLERLKVWLQLSKNQKKFKDFVRINHELNKENVSINIQEALDKVLQQINGAKQSEASKFVSIFKYAVILIGFSIIGYGIYQSTTDTITAQQVPQIVLQLEDGTTQIVNAGQHMVIKDAQGKRLTEQKDQELVYSNQEAADTVLHYNTLKVPNGTTFGLTLSDGSKVTLNAGSELKYPVQFITNEKNRTVYLNGEAFFEVAKNEKQPFIVNTKDMDVEVLGTQFNVTSYTMDDKTYTVLVEGTVAAHNKLAVQEAKVLNPNQKVFFEGNMLTKEVVNVQKYIAWVYGQLVFVDDSFEVINNKLERKYNVTINNTYIALNDINITATFKNETIEQVLKTFQTYKSFEYTIKNGVVTITEPK